ncbi:MAG: heme-dependent oxidative N-demethylase family protein [Acidimicrobiales bacterium]
MRPPTPAVPAWLDELDLKAGPPWLSMGIRTLDLDDWLVVDDRYAAEVDLKARLLAERPDDVFAARPAALDACAEVLELVADWLAAHHPERPPARGSDRHPLDAAGRRVQEDLCVLLEHDGTYTLEAASLCFPSHWRLHDKLGRSLAAIHAPVPHYASELEAKVDRFFGRLRVDRPVVRRNLSIHCHDDLFRPEPHESPESFAPDASGIDQVWLRSERQTLVRLPRTGAVLFTIKTQLCPVTALRHRPELAGALSAKLASEQVDLGSRGDTIPFPPWLIHWLEDVSNP